jgi:hypothetical protein
LESEDKDFGVGCERMELMQATSVKTKKSHGFVSGRDAKKIIGELLLAFGLT